MQRSHLVFFFVLLFVLLCLSTVEKEWQYSLAEQKKEQIDEALVLSSDMAAEQLVSSYSEGNMSSLLVNAEKEFFRSLSVSLGVLGEAEEEEALYFFVPLLLVTDTEGFYINTLKESEQNGAKILAREWTECQPYYYSDDNFIYRFFLDDGICIIRKDSPDDVIITTYKDAVSNASLMAQMSTSRVFRSENDFKEVKRAAIAQCIERAAGRALADHNYIAGQHNISLFYSVPSFLENYTPAMDYSSLLAVFQGYPLSARYNIIYNNCSTSAAYITKRATYVVEVSDSMSQPYSVFHRDGCTYIDTYGKVLERKVSENEAVVRYGAYACPHCFSETDGVAILP